MGRRWIALLAGLMTAAAVLLDPETVHARRRTARCCVRPQPPAPDRPEIFCFVVRVRARQPVGAGAMCRLIGGVPDRA